MSREGFVFIKRLRFTTGEVKELKILRRRRRKRMSRMRRRRVNSY